MSVLSRPDVPVVWKDRRAITLLLAATLTVMANATISPALPGIEREFAGPPNVGLLTRFLVSAPSLTVLFCAPIAGLIADRYGRRWMLLAGIALFAMSGAAGAVLPSLSAIMASRLLLGVAVALIMTAQTALIGDFFTGDARRSMMGLQTSARNFGGLIFITSAGWLALMSPRLPFAIYGVAILLLPVIWRHIPEPPRQSAANANAPTGGGNPQQTAPAMWHIPLLGLAMLQMITSLIFFMMPTQLPFFLASQGADNAAMTGGLLGALTLSGGLAALLYVRINRSFGAAGAYALGYALMGSGFLLLTAGADGIQQGVAAVAIGAGFATVMPNFVALALALAPAHRRGMVGGVLTSAVFLGQILSPVVSIPGIAEIGFLGVFRAAAVLLAGLALGAAMWALIPWLKVILLEPMRGQRRSR
ncbi:MFS transporter [Phaeobacter porticola]|uniref:Putative major facilitator superfamily transporter n=1 Tax=Phaeobacter porticola TaxID=1844006 RepID=A0A1L3I0J4_9RHOB|nr:MFS transporter [Phaeobacter porticola]APG45636.1 putative major facilitator superfamily transporter [Phaeobacter porticola]